MVPPPHRSQEVTPQKGRASKMWNSVKPDLTRVFWACCRLITGPASGQSSLDHGRFSSPSPLPRDVSPFPCRVLCAQRTPHAEIRKCVGAVVEDTRGPLAICKPKVHDRSGRRGPPGEIRPISGFASTLISRVVSGFCRRAGHVGAASRVGGVP